MAYVIGSSGLTPYPVHGGISRLDRRRFRARGWWCRVKGRRQARRAVSAGGRTLFLMATLAMGTAAHSSTQNEVCPELELWFHLTEQTRLLLTGSGTRDAESGEKTRGAYGLYLNYRANVHISYRAGYLYLEGLSRAGEKNSTEHREVLDFNYRWQIADHARLGDRTRVDLREMNNETTYCLRNRLRLDRELQVEHMMLGPYASLEAFYDSHLDRVNRLLFELGTAVPTGNQVDWDFYLARQRDVYPKTRFVNAIRITLNIRY